MGLVEIYGKVVPQKEGLMKSPFTAHDCVYYKYIIQEYRRSGKNSQWVTVKKGQDHRLFYLKDETGMVLINPKDAKIDIPKDNQIESGLGHDPPAAAKAFLAAQNVRYEGLLGINKTMRYIEYFIAPDDHLYIMGTATDNPYTEEASAVKGVQDVMIAKGKHHKFYYISDRTEKDVLQRYRWKTYGGIIIGAILISLGTLMVM